MGTRPCDDEGHEVTGAKDCAASEWAEKMKKLIIHPGSPKTATSSFQHYLRNNKAKLEERGIGVVLPRDIRGSRYLGAYLEAYRGRPVADLPQIARDFYRPFLDAFDTVILSEETMCHDFMPSKRFGHGGIDRAEEAARLIAQSGFDDYQIVLTIRPQWEMLTSTYTHFVHRHREARSFGEWVTDEVALDRMMWADVVQAFAQVFGRRAVSVVSMVGPFAEYRDRFLKALGSGIDWDLADEGAVFNPSPSARAVSICRMLNREIREPQKSERINTLIVDQFPAREYGKYLPHWQLPPKWAAAFDADFARAVAP